MKKVKNALKSVKLHIEYNTLTKGLFNNSISGNIYWQYNNRFFPENHWFDCVSPLLALWSNALLNLSTGCLKKINLQFMGCPCFIRVCSNTHDCILMQFFDHEQQEYPRDEYTTDINSVLSTFFIASTRVLDWYGKNFDDAIGTSLADEMLIVELNSNSLRKNLKL